MTTWCPLYVCRQSSMYLFAIKRIQQNRNCCYKQLSLRSLFAQSFKSKFGNKFFCIILRGTTAMGYPHILKIQHLNNNRLLTQTLLGFLSTLGVLLWAKYEFRWALSPENVPSWVKNEFLLENRLDDLLVFFEEKTLYFFIKRFKKKRRL